MRLIDALRLDRSTRLALVGSGGKTTALFQLGSEYEPPVLLTATTHLAVDQLGQAEKHISLPAKPAVEQILAMVPEGRMLVTGPEVGGDRVAGVSRDTAQILMRWSKEHRIPFLCEADGSRQRPLKSPAAHEPVIPKDMTHVVVMAGLSALGQPLSEAWVHRPELFADLSGLQINDPLTQEAMVRVLCHSQGGLKAVPFGVRRIVILNQADNPDQLDAAQRMAPALLSEYHAVVVAALRPPTGIESGIRSVHEPCAGVILAAGESQRFGQPKPLLSWGQQPFVRHIARTALNAGLDPIVVVTGLYHDRIKAVLADLSVQVVHNPYWNSGQSSSLNAGMQRVPSQVGSVIFLLADQPQVPESLLRALIARHAEGLAPLVAPSVGGQRANPVLFDRCTFPDLERISGEVGGRALFDRYEMTFLPWADPGLLLDVDTEADYQHLLTLYP